MVGGRDPQVVGEGEEVVPGRGQGGIGRGQSVGNGRSRILDGHIVGARGQTHRHNAPHLCAVDPRQVGQRRGTHSNLGPGFEVGPVDGHVVGHVVEALAGHHVLADRACVHHFVGIHQNPTPAIRVADLQGMLADYQPRRSQGPQLIGVDPTDVGKRHRAQKDRWRRHKARPPNRHELGRIVRAAGRLDGRHRRRLHRRCGGCRCWRRTGSGSGRWRCSWRDRRRRQRQHCDRHRVSWRKAIRSAGCIVRVDKFAIDFSKTGNRHSKSKSNTLTRRQVLTRPANLSVSQFPSALRIGIAATHRQRICDGHAIDLAVRAVVNGDGVGEQLTGRYRVRPCALGDFKPIGDIGLHRRCWACGKRP